MYVCMYVMVVWYVVHVAPQVYVCPNVIPLTHLFQCLNLSEVPHFENRW